LDYLPFDSLGYFYFDSKETHQMKKKEIKWTGWQSFLYLFGTIISLGNPEVGLAFVDKYGNK